MVRTKLQAQQSVGFARGKPCAMLARRGIAPRAHLPPVSVPKPVALPAPKPKPAPVAKKPKGAVKKVTTTVTKTVIKKVTKKTIGK